MYCHVAKGNIAAQWNVTSVPVSSYFLADLSRARQDVVVDTGHRGKGMVWWVHALDLGRWGSGETPMRSGTMPHACFS